MTNFTPEMIEKAKTAASPEELLDLAKANGVDLSADEAAAYFTQLSPRQGELSDDELDCVAGGGCGSKSSSNANVRYGFDLNLSNKVYFEPYCPTCRQAYYDGIWHYGSTVNHGYLYWLDKNADKWEVECKKFHKVGTYTGDPAKHQISKCEW